MMNEKPQLGTPPYYIIAESRIKDLTGAIDRCVTHKAYENVKEWAREIFYQADLLIKMGEEE